MIAMKKIGEGMPVMLLHGFPNDHHTWDAVVPTLSAELQLLLPDFPGVGASQRTAGALSMGRIAELLRERLDEEGIEKLVIVGHSMGGYAAVHFAARFPERVSGLSFVHSSARADSEEKKTMRDKAIRLMKKGAAEKRVFLKEMAGKLFVESFAERHPHVVQTIVENGLKIETSVLAAFYEAMRDREDQTATLQHADFPVQWIAGAEDEVVPLQAILEQSLCSRVTDLVVYLECGHMSMLEQPERLGQDLLRFCRFVAQ